MKFLMTYDDFVAWECIPTYSAGNIDFTTTTFTTGAWTTWNMNPPETADSVTVSFTVDEWAEFDD